MNGLETPKPKIEYEKNYKKMISLNAKATNIIFCVLDRNNFNKTSGDTSAHNIWHDLEVTDEGISQVKESNFIL